mmetsp:Transcript_44688/g.107792  ORF Transcript_44688/g.107792 Transcript_44688/m.107792 type:complete len:561 (-) Transcript_44688:1209-2891(-)
MIVYRRRPPNEYYQVNKDHATMRRRRSGGGDSSSTSSKPVLDGRKKKWKDRGRNENPEKKKKFDMLSKALLPSSITRKFFLGGWKNKITRNKKNKVSSDNYYPDSDGDTVTAGSSHVSVGGYHSLSDDNTASHQQSSQQQEERIENNVRLPRSSRRKRRNQAFYTDMTGMVVSHHYSSERPHHAFNRYQIPQSLPSVREQSKPKTKEADRSLSSTKPQKDPFASFVDTRTTTSSQWRNQSLDLDLEDVGNLPSLWISKSKKKKKKSPTSQDPLFDSFVKTREPSLQWNPPPCKREKEEEVKEDSNAKAGESHPLTVPVVTKQRMVKFSETITVTLTSSPAKKQDIHRGDIMKFNNEEEEEQYPFDEEIEEEEKEEYPFDENIIEDVSNVEDNNKDHMQGQDRQEQEEEEYPFDCYDGVGAAIPLVVSVDKTSSSFGKKNSLSSLMFFNDRRSVLMILPIGRDDGNDSDQETPSQDPEFPKRANDRGCPVKEGCPWDEEKEEGSSFLDSAMKFAGVFAAITLFLLLCWIAGVLEVCDKIGPPQDRYSVEPSDLLQWMSMNK